MNPQLSMPTLVDNGFVLWESRAIMTYLTEMYGNDETLYPKVPKERAVIHQRLYFDMGGPYAKFSEYFMALVFKKVKDAEKLKAIDTPLEFLNTFLEGQEYVAGPNLTLADIALVTTISSLDAMQVDLEKFSNITRWYKHCREIIPGYEVNQHGADLLKKLM